LIVCSIQNYQIKLEIQDKFVDNG